MPCFTAMRAEIALMSGSAFAVTHHAFSSGAGRTSDGNGSHASTLKSPSYTKSVSWQHYRLLHRNSGLNAFEIGFATFYFCLKPGDICTIIPIIETQDNIAFFYALIIAHLYSRNITRNFTCHRGDITTNVSIIRRLYKSSFAYPPDKKDNASQKNTDRYHPNKLFFGNYHHSLHRIYPETCIRHI
ncbi:putative transposase [Shigella flexneri K-272]|nr:putative transposase [Shigella flexneri K-272]